MNKTYLYDRINTDLDLCGFSENVKYGLLFSLGACLQSKINLISAYKEIVSTDDWEEEFKECINAYAQVPGDYENTFEGSSGQINEFEINNILYSYAHIALNVIGEQNIDIDEEFRQLHPDLPMKVVQAELIDDYISNYSVDWSEYRIENKVCVNVFHNLQEELFERIGNHINSAKMSKKQAYDAGYSYFTLMSSFDLKGIIFLINTLLHSLVPLFNAFLCYPFLNQYMPDALRYNHIFSHIFQYFIHHIDPVIGMPVHQYHQVIFYDDDSTFREDWVFDINKDVDLATKLFTYACEIRNTTLMNDKSVYVAVEGLSFSYLKKMRLTVDDFRWEIEKGIFKKYGIRAPRPDEGGWTSAGDLIQFCSIYFYESCLHALVLDELSD